MDRYSLCSHVDTVPKFEIHQSISVVTLTHGQQRVVEITNTRGRDELLKGVWARPQEELRDPRGSSKSERK